METIPSVEAFVHRRLLALGVDADSFANYVAGVLADTSLPVEERTATLRECLVLTVEDRDIGEDVDALLAESFLFQASEEVACREAAAQAALEANARRAEVAANADDVEKARDAARKKALVAQYGYIHEEDDEGGASAGAGTGSARSAKKVAEPKAGSSKERSGRLDDALDEIDDAVAVHAKDPGMGRRAKRATDRVAEAQRVAARAADRAGACIDALSPCASAHAATAGFDSDDSVEGAPVATPAASTAAAAGDPVASGGRAVVLDYDPLAQLGRIDNRAVAREREKGRMEEERSKHAAEERRGKEAAEAARAAREMARQLRFNTSAK